MYISKSIKEALVNVKEGADKGIALRLEVDQEATDQAIYDLEKVMLPLIEGKVLECSIVERKINIMDQEPTEPQPPIPPIDPPPPTTNDIILTLTNMQGEVYNVGLSDAEVYGAALDGQNRKVNLYWKDSNNVEHKVPLLGFDTDEPKNPNKQWSYYSEGDYINFEIAVSSTVEYILRKEV